MKLQRENVIRTVDEETRAAAMLRAGWVCVRDDPPRECEARVCENDSHIDSSALDAMTADELRAFARERGIALGGATKRINILQIIRKGATR